MDKKINKAEPLEQKELAELKEGCLGNWVDKHCFKYWLNYSITLEWLFRLEVTIRREWSK